MCSSVAFVRHLRGAMCQNAPQRFLSEPAISPSLAKQKLYYLPGVHISDPLMKSSALRLGIWACIYAATCFTFFSSRSPTQNVFAENNCCSKVLVKMRLFFFCFVAFFTFPQTTLQLLPFQTFCWNLSEKQHTNKQTSQRGGLEAF